MGGGTLAYFKWELQTQQQQSNDRHQFAEQVGAVMQLISVEATEI